MDPKDEPQILARGRPEDVLRFETGRPEGAWKEKRRPFLVSTAVHAAIIGILLIPLAFELGFDEPPAASVLRIRFYTPGGEGPGGGGGGGGSQGEDPTASLRPQPEPEPEQPVAPRRAPAAPRRVPSLRFDRLEVPDLPTQTSMLFDHVYSPDEMDAPGLSLADGTDYGGIDRAPSAGSGGGIGGGEGTGVGVGKGWGVGAGEGGGYGGGQYRPGGYDVEPKLRYQPPEPSYPPEARERMVTGEVILQILVKEDGSTEVVGVIKSLPYCVSAAMENAKLWRWKPALKNGQPVEAYGIITVKFDLFSQSGRSSPGG